MTTANDFMKAAAQLRALREEMRQPVDDKYAIKRELIAVYLLTAATECQRIGEDLAKGEAKATS